MGLLEDCITDASEHFIDSDVFGESVVYTKKDGTTRTINATIVRQPPLITGGEMMGTPHMQVWVKNNATTGISVSELDCGGDTITTTYPKGGTSRKFLIMRNANEPHVDMGLLALWLG